jgi:hypothetical protein
MNPLRMVRVFVIALIAMTVFGLVFAAGTRAYAENNPQASTRKVAWVVTSGDFTNRWATPQRLATASDTCGVLEQIDLYRYDTPAHRATVDALIEKGTLAGAGEDGSVWLSNEDVTLPTCASTPPVTTPPSPPTSAPTAPPVTVSPSPTSSPTTPPSMPSTPSGPTPSATPVQSMPSPSSVPPTASATPTVTTHLKTGTGQGELAFTGSRGDRILALLAVTAILLGVALFLVTRRRGEKR